MEKDCLLSSVCVSVHCVSLRTEGELIYQLLSDHWCVTCMCIHFVPLFISVLG